MSRPELYRTVWRWHFYAGILVAPFMLILALTGAIYLFNDEINDILHRDKRIVPAADRAVPLSRMIDSALAGFPGGTVTRIDTPGDPGRTAQLFVAPAAGEPVRVFVDPGTGKVMGSYVYTHTLVGFADVMHGSLMLGDVGDAIVELAACWGFILMVTGLYLWWPRGHLLITHVLLPRWSVGGRAFWRSVHASIGLWSALLVMFLIVTGLPWATVWGGLLRKGTELAGIGYPASFRAPSAPVSNGASVKEISAGAAPWTIEGEPAPRSDPHAGHAGPHLQSAPHGGHRIGVDEVASILAKHGMAPPYRLSLPRDADGVYAAFSYPDQPETQRTLYIDQYSGEVLGDVGFGDYGWAAKAVELGVQIHMGNYFGRANQVVMLIPCFGIMVLCVTGPYMWWLRRPEGAFGAPRALAAPTARAIALITIGLSLVFPLAGASLLTVMVLDSMLRRFVPKPI